MGWLLYFNDDLHIVHLVPVLLVVIVPEFLVGRMIMSIVAICCDWMHKGKSHLFVYSQTNAIGTIFSTRRRAFVGGRLIRHFTTTKINRG